MSTPASPVVATAAPAKPLTAIQVIEKELQGFGQQAAAAAKAAEQATANVHAVNGAIQAAQHLLAKLKAEAEKAEAEVKKVAGEVEAEIKKL